MSIEVPHYRDYFPNMSQIPWTSTNSSGKEILEYDMLPWLYKIANSSLHGIYGDFDAFTLDPSQPLNFSQLDYDHFIKDSHGPLIYLSFWGLATLFLIIAGYCWCVCNKCCCFLCVVAKRENQDYEEINGEKKVRRISCHIVGLVVLMSVWLLILMVLIYFTFAVNEKTSQVMKGVRKDLNKTARDMELYFDTTRRQIRYTFQTCFWTLRDKINNILSHCTGTGCGLVKERLKKTTQDALDRTSEYVFKHSMQLDIAVSNVQKKVNTVEKELKQQYGQPLVDLSSSIHGIFTTINLLYCLVFVLVMVSTVFLSVGGGRCVRTVGLLILRCAVVLMFALGIAAIFQLASLFVAAGVTAEIVCPAIKRLEQQGPVRHALEKRDGKDLMIVNINYYKAPEYSVVIRECKNDYSAYKAFNFKNAYDVHDILNLPDSNFNIDITKIISLSELPHFLPPSVNGLPTASLLKVMSQLPPNQLQQIIGALSGNHNPSLISSLNPTSPIGKGSLIGSMVQKRVPKNVAGALDNSSQQSLPPPVSLTPIEVVHEIQVQVQHYTRFVVSSVEDELGKCKPAYNAINATINLFCDKLVAPVTSLWWVLQFAPPTFTVIIFTAIFLEQAHQ